MPLFSDDDDAPSGDRPMTLREHLDELRRRALWCVLIAGAAAVGCWMCQDALLGIALAPANSVLKEIPNSELISTETGEKFLTAMKLDLVAGIFISSPLILYVLWGFVARGLHAKEKRFVRIYSPVSYLLFLAGCWFFYFELQPLFLSYLLRYETSGIVGPSGEQIPIAMKLEFGKQVNFFLVMSLVTGLIFELPLVMLFLQAIGVCDWRTYLKYAKHFNFGMLVAITVFSPASDVYSITLFMVPVVALFFGGVLVCKLKAPKEATEERSA